MDAAQLLQLSVCTTASQVSPIATLPKIAMVIRTLAKRTPARGVSDLYMIPPVGFERAICAFGGSMGRARMSMDHGCLTDRIAAPVCHLTEQLQSAHRPGGN
jgi:hypothetical protein